MAKRRALAAAAAAITPIQFLALSKSVKGKDYDTYRDQVKPGTYQIALDVGLSGVLTVAPDVPGAAASEQPASNFSPWLLLLLALKSENAPTLEQLGARAAKVLEGGGDPAGEQLLQAQFSAQAAARLPRVLVPSGGGRRGSVSFSGLIFPRENLAQAVDLFK